MAAPGQMSYADLQQMTLQLGHITDLGLAKMFVNDAYEQVWTAQKWTFRRALVNVTVAIGTQEIANVPADLGRVNGLWRGAVGAGQRLTYIYPDVFVNRWSNNNTAIVQSGPPYEYTVVDDEILVGPASNEAATDYTLMHEKRFTPLEADTDVPALPLGTHMIIAYGSAKTALISENDFFFQFCDGQYQARLAAMTAEYTVTTDDEPQHWPSEGESWPTYSQF